MDNRLTQKGFTLIEVLVMTILLALAFLVFLGALNFGKSMQDRSNLRSIQSFLMHDLEEQIKSRRYDESRSSPWSSDLGLDTNPSHYLSLDGDDYGSVSGADLARTGDFTIEISFRTNQRVNKWQGVIGKGNGQNRNYGLWIRADGNALFQVYGSANVNVYPNYIFNLNTWYHYVGVREGSIHKLYINGQLIDSENYGDGDPVTTNDPLKIGSVGSDYFKGDVKEARFWSVARTQSQIQNSMEDRIDPNSAGLIGYWPLNEGTGSTINDLSVSGYNGSLYGGSWGVMTSGESLLSDFDDVDDFDGYTITEYEKHKAYGANVQVDYVNQSTKFRVISSSPTNYKRVVVQISHTSLSGLSDTLIIGKGL